jgi:hypothetical protein
LTKIQHLRLIGGKPAGGGSRLRPRVHIDGGVWQLEIGHLILGLKQVPRVWLFAI